MFRRTKESDIAMEGQLERLVLELGSHKTESVEYQKILERISEIENILDRRKIFKVSPDTILIVGANILGLMMIMHFEKTGVITTKAFSGLIKGRV